MYANKIPMKVLSRYVSIIHLMRQAIDEFNITTVGMCDLVRSKLHSDIALLAGVEKGDVKFEVWLGETVNHMLDCQLSVADALKHESNEKNEL